MAHPPRPYRRALVRAPSVLAILQNLVELDSASGALLSERAGIPASTIYEALARMSVRGLVKGVLPPVADDDWGRVSYHYALTGEGKNLAAAWGITPRPRDLPIQGQTP